MAFWNRKKETTIYNSSPSDEEMKKALLKTSESIDRASAQISRSCNELVKALNTATREFKKSK